MARAASPLGSEGQVREAPPKAISIIVSAWNGLGRWLARFCSVLCLCIVSDSVTTGKERNLRGGGCSSAKGDLRGETDDVTHILIIMS